MRACRIVCTCATGRRDSSGVSGSSGPRTRPDYTRRRSRRSARATAARSCRDRGAAAPSSTSRLPCIFPGTPGRPLSLARAVPRQLEVDYFRALAERRAAVDGFIRIVAVGRMAVSEVWQLDRGGERASTVMSHEACRRRRSTEEHVTAVDSVACGLA